jgi:transcription-repair coupling factor (superfamily II helicase)
MYQRMVEAQTVAEVRALRQEIEDRFGTPPEEALHLLTWLQIKALALRAHVSSVVTTDDEFVIRQPVMDQMARERLRRRFGRDPTVRIGPQFVRLDRQALGANWVEKLSNLLELLGT